MSTPPQFKSYPKGKLSFINVKAEKVKTGYPPLFNYKDKRGINSEELGKEYYKSLGYNAKFCENEIWNSFFNHLIYKNLKKSYELGEISTANKDRFDDGFYKENTIAINRIFDSLLDINIKEYFEDIYKDSYNELSENMINHRPKVLIAAELLENHQILIVMEYLIKDYIHNRRGFPDLMVWNDEEIFFAEIKANTDILSRRQVKAHKALNNAGIDVVLLAINKNKNGLRMEEKRYYKKRKPTKTDYKGRYNFLLETANEKAEELKESNSEEALAKFKTKFYNKSATYFIAYLNILNQENIRNLERSNIREEEVIEEENLIKFLSLMAEAKALEDKNMLREAIEKYKEIAEDERNAGRYEAYNRICICYRKNSDHANEMAVIKNIVNDDQVPKDKKRKFKRRIERAIKKQEYHISNELCPKCNQEYLKYKIYKPTNSKICRCTNCKHTIIK